ncbi:MAG: alanine--tRNA ligase [Phycisphaerales bacterium]|nr:alanine--tRNA ligase [Phycisphaerales bacterium]
MTQESQFKPSRSIPARQIRQDFIDFFAEKAGHTIVPSSPVIPHDDPTLLFINAGMNQFKDVFLGLGDRPYQRAVDVQKCIRAGGKHNDLEDVGCDTYHHTFFEMLGNWSFGDYFKAEAITWAWQLLTEVWGLPKERLHITVFEGSTEDGTEPDEEAHKLWLECTDVDPSHITRWGRKDNFWEMGASGPCGPCSEIHFDNTPDCSGGKLVNLDHPDVIEIWNLVFIQFNRGEDGLLTKLPASHVDTGMGFERITRILQGKNSNYDTDLWTPLFECIQKCSNGPAYGGKLDDPTDTAYRIIADHVRCLTVALADGARPGNEGRAYVLRRILRRAVRMVHQVLDVHEPMLCRVVPAVVASLGDVYPEIAEHEEAISNVIREEELAFLRTLERGLALFDEAASNSSDGNISGEAAFTLHDTFGFPIDLTELMSRERGLAVDRAGYDVLMEEARARSRASTGGEQAMNLPANALADLAAQNVAATDDAIKYQQTTAESQVLAIWNGREFVKTLDNGSSGGVILDHTPFYAEQGGQVGDTGSLSFDGGLFKVSQTARFGDFVLHEGMAADGALECGGAVKADVEQDRRQSIESNHTATHLLNHALRDVLGDEVQQKGSLVAPDRLRFDYSHAQAPTPEELGRIEDLVRAGISNGQEVHAAEMPLDHAMTITGVRAVFGERYPDPVRVVSIGASSADLAENPTNPVWMNHSIEFCGGTHVQKTDVINAFILVQEQSLAAGVRRLMALTGDTASQVIQEGESILAEVKNASDLDDAGLVAVVERISPLVDEQTLGVLDKLAIRTELQSLQKRVKLARKSAAKSTRETAVVQAKAIADAADGEVITSLMEGVAARDDLLAAMDAIRAKHGESACLLLGTDPEAGKVVMVARVPDNLIERGLKAGDWVKHVAGLCGGGGGGRPDMAQAGGSKPEEAGAAAKAAHDWASEQLK